MNRVMIFSPDARLSANELTDEINKFLDEQHADAISLNVRECEDYYSDGSICDRWKEATLVYSKPDPVQPAALAVQPGAAGALNMSALLNYCYKLSRLVSPHDAEMSYGLEHDGLIGDFLWELAYNGVDNINLSDDCWAEAYARILKGGKIDL